VSYKEEKKSSLQIHRVGKVDNQARPNSGWMAANVIHEWQ